MNFSKHALVLIVGLFFIVCGCNLLVAFFSELESYSYLLLPNVLLIFGLLVLYISITGKRKAFYTFIGLLFCSSWLFVLLISAKVMPYTIMQVWPILVLLSGLMLIPLGFIRYGFLPISFIVSACVLFCLGTLFLLFSLDIIKMSIVDFVVRWWPMVFVFTGLLLVFLFFYMQKHEREKWVKNSDDFEDLS